MKKSILALIASIFIVGCEHDDCHDHYHYRDCEYYPIHSHISDVRGYLEEHASDVPSSQYRYYFSEYFDVIGPVYHNSIHGDYRIVRYVTDYVDTTSGYLVSYTRFRYPPTDEVYYIVEYYRNW